MSGQQTRRTFGYGDVIKWEGFRHNGSKGMNLIDIIYPTVILLMTLAGALLVLEIVKRRM